MWRRREAYDPKPDVQLMMVTLMRMDGKLDRILDVLEDDGEEEEVSEGS